MNQHVNGLPQRPDIPDFPHGETLRDPLFDILPGVHLLPVPTVLRVGPVNAIAIREVGGPFADGWTIIDPGPDSRAAREAWIGLSERLLQGYPVRRVIVSHGHADHVGLAGWFHRRDGAELWISAASWQAAHHAQTRDPAEKRAETERFLKRCGYRRSMLDAYRAHAFVASRPTDPLPQQFRSLTEGEEIAIGSWNWKVAFGQGHARDHAILINRDAGAIVCGDQILTVVPPDTGVTPSQPDGDPLGMWQRSCQLLGTMIDDSMLTIPGHGAPFRGARRRLATIRQAQDRGLDRLDAFVSRPRTTIECFEAFYGRSLNPAVDTAALLLTHAYLNHLQRSRRILSIPRPDGVLLWSV